MPNAAFSRARVAFRRATQAPASVIGGADRRRARVAITILGWLSVAGLVDLVFSLVGVNQASAEDLLISFVAVTFLACAYAVARRGHVAWGVVLGLLALDGGVIGWRLSAPGPSPDSLYLLTVPILAGGLLLKPRNAVRATVFTVLLAWFAEYFADKGAGVSIDPQDVILGLLLVVIGGVAIAASSLAAEDARSLEEEREKVDGARRALEEAAAERRRMFNQVAHDLAQPLEPISIQAYLMAHQPPGADMTQSVAILGRNVSLLKRQVEDLKDLVRIEGKGMRLAVQRVDLRQAAGMAADSFRPIGATKGVTVDASGPAAWVNADPARLDQIINNLLSNAVKFTPAGGSVRLTTETAGPTASLTVTDTGRGLTAEELGRLFRPFSQVHRPGETTERGTGLGLFIARGIAEAHGGAVSVVSRGLGQGSAFTLQLPGTGAGLVLPG